MTHKSTEKTEAEINADKLTASKYIIFGIGRTRQTRYVTAVGRKYKSLGE